MLCIITFFFKNSCLFNIACFCSILMRCISRHIIYSYSKCEDLNVDKILTWENSRLLAKLPIIGFPSKRHLRNERRNSILMMRHYPAARPIRSTTQTWVVIRHPRLCSSRARWPLAPNFCPRATRKFQIFHTNHMLGTLDFTVSEHWAPFNFS